MLILLIDVSKFAQDGNSFIRIVGTVKNRVIGRLVVIETTTKRDENILKFTLEDMTKEVVKVNVLPSR